MNAFVKCHRPQSPQPRRYVPLLLLIIFFIIALLLHACLSYFHASLCAFETNSLHFLTLFFTKATPMDSSGQPTVPILRVPDPNSRKCFENFNNANTTITSPCKRPRKQSNSGSVIKKQCTWELRTDPMDSNKSVWRSPLERTDQQSPSRLLQDSETVDTLKREADSIGTADSVIHGRPMRMRMYKPSHPTSRFSGVWKGPKTGHFLRFA